MRTTADVPGANYTRVILRHVNAALLLGVTACSEFDEPVAPLEAHSPARLSVSAMPTRSDTADAVVEWSDGHSRVIAGSAVGEALLPRGDTKNARLGLGVDDRAWTPSDAVQPQFRADVAAPPSVVNAARANVPRPGWRAHIFPEGTWTRPTVNRQNVNITSVVTFLGTHGSNQIQFVVSGTDTISGGSSARTGMSPVVRHCLMSGSVYALASCPWGGSFTSRQEVVVRATCGVKVDTRGTHLAWFGVPPEISVGAYGVSVSGGLLTFRTTPDHMDQGGTASSPPCERPTVRMLVRAGASAVASEGGTLAVPRGVMYVSFQDNGSTVPDGQVNGWTWLLNGRPIASSSAYGTHLPAGTHTLTLRATTTLGTSAEATVRIVVEPHDPSSAPPCDGLSVEQCGDGTPGTPGGGSGGGYSATPGTIYTVVAGPAAAAVGAPNWYWVCTVQEWYVMWSGAATGGYRDRAVRDCNWTTTLP